jgi:uncharacterized protein
MIPILIIILSSIIGIFLFGNILTAIFQERFIFRGKTVPPNFDYQLSKNTEEFYFNTNDGGKIHAVLFKINPDQQASRVVMFYHGNTGNMLRWKNVAHQFKSRGCDVMIMDYRGYGKSSGKRNETTFFQDALFVYDEVAKRYTQPNIIIYGKSIGTAAASYVAGYRKPRKVMLETPFYSMVDLFYTYYQLFPRLFRFKYSFKNHEYLKRAQCSIHIIAAGKDLVVPKKSSSKLQSVLKDTDEFIMVEQGQHNDLAMYDIFQEFLDRNLR